MSPTIVVCCAVFIVIASLLRGLTGFGFAIVAAPLLALVVSPLVAVADVGAPAVTAPLAKVTTEELLKCVKFPVIVTETLLAPWHPCQTHNCWLLPSVAPIPPGNPWEVCFPT